MLVKKSIFSVKKTNLVIASILLTPSILFSGIINEDKPLRGRWNFNMEKLWDVEEAGKDFFASMSIRSDENETVFVADWRNFKTYIFDKRGAFISSFGKKGEGPGEMKDFGSLFLKNNKLIFYESSKVHYFSKHGKYIKSEVIPRGLRPRLFIDENSFISAPRMNWEDPKGRGQAVIYNIQDKSKKLLFEFSTFKKGVARRTSASSRSTFSFSSSSITPIIILAYCNNKIYYGMNNEYKIKVKDLTTQDEFAFGLKREKKVVPHSYKDEILKGIDFPDDVKKQIKEGFPDHFTFFEKIVIDKNSNIYVFVTDPLKENSIKIDIFSPQGKYMYFAEINIEKGLAIHGDHFKKDKLYLGIENEEGDLKLVKYKIDLPENSAK